MKRLAFATLLISTPALAETPVKTYVLSETLVNEIFVTLKGEPWDKVNPVLSHLQGEVLKQPTVTAKAPEPESAK